MVLACGTIASFSWGLGFYGLGVYLHDALGSYRPALWCLVALEAVAVASVLWGRALRRRSATSAA